MAGSISATIIDIRNNQPIGGAAVALTGPKSDKTVTGEDGQFKFSDLPAANDYKLDVAKSQYDTEHYEDIVVIDDVDTNLQYLALIPSDY